MRMQVYYEYFLRRDIQDKLGSGVGDFEKITLRLSCKGFQKIGDVAVVKSLLLLEALSGSKSDRTVGVSKHRFLSSFNFTSFMCTVVLKHEFDMFCFIDNWVSIYGFDFTVEGGIVRINEDYGLLLTYENLNDYLEFMTRFYRFKSVLNCKFEFQGYESMVLVLKGMRFI